MFRNSQVVCREKWLYSRFLLSQNNINNKNKEDRSEDKSYFIVKNEDKNKDESDLIVKNEDKNKDESDLIVKNEDKNKDKSDLIFKNGLTIKNKHIRENISSKDIDKSRKAAKDFYNKFLEEIKNASNINKEEIKDDQNTTNKKKILEVIIALNKTCNILMRKNKDIELKFADLEGMINDIGLEKMISNIGLGVINKDDLIEYTIWINFHRNCGMFVKTFFLFIKFFIDKLINDFRNFIFLYNHFANIFLQGDLPDGFNKFIFFPMFFLVSLTVFMLIPSPITAVVIGLFVVIYLIYHYRHNPNYNSGDYLYSYTNSCKDIFKENLSPYKNREHMRNINSAKEMFEFFLAQN